MQTFVFKKTNILMTEEGVEDVQLTLLSYTHCISMLI